MAAGLHSSVGTTVIGSVDAVMPSSHTLAGKRVKQVETFGRWSDGSVQEQTGGTRQFLSSRTGGKSQIFAPYPSRWYIYQSNP